MQVNIDFQVITNNNPKFLIVIDTSDWGILEEKPSAIEISVPGFKESISHYFDKGKVNIFHSINLNLNCPGCDIKESDYLDLPDGMYTITVKGSAEKFCVTKYFLKTDLIRYSLDKAFINFSIECESPCKDFINKIQEIDFLIKAAEANTRLGNPCEAQELLDRANKEIKKLNKCKTCV